MKLKLSDTQIISFLILALLLQVLLLLWHLEILDLGADSKKNQNQQLAGTIESIENKLKTRPMSSLIWESATAPAEVFFYDSILTLSQSTAKIELNNGTQIQLSENTLITIEPPEKSQNNEIKILFSQGNLKARNPYKEATIKDDQLTLNLSQNSEVEVLKNKKGEYEVQINQGQATVKKDNEEIQLNENQIINIGPKFINKTEISSALVWKDINLKRVYSHKESARLELEWQGEAQKLIVLNPDQSKREISLNPKSYQYQLELPLGEYRLALGNKGKQSLRLPVQIWKAPIIQLLEPLPRNREKFGRLQFIWTLDQNFDSFEVELKSKNSSKRVPANENKAEILLEEELDLQWGVWGVDKKGFKSPPRYFYPLFIRKNPFAPPKLKKPQLAPKKKNKTSWIHWLIPRAQAESLKEAYFKWEEIPGADVYFIEISESKDFRKPLVQKRLTRNEYIWKGAKEKQEYYWRVAAGDNQGRMGEFTAATLVDWEQLKPPQVEKPKPKKVVLVKPKRQEPKPPPVKKVVIEEPKQVMVPDDNESSQEFFFHFNIYYLPNYSFRKFKENGITKAELTGLGLLQLAVDLAIPISENWQFWSYLKYGQNSYKPSSENRFPFQNNIDIENILGLLSLFSENSSMGYGLLINQNSDMERSDFEIVRSKPIFIYGPLLQYKTSFWILESQSNLAFVSDSDRYGGFLNQKLLLHPLNHFVTGLELEVFYLGSGDSRFSTYEASIILGFTF